MEDVTDTSFREVVAGLSDPQYLHILFTEFTSVDGMNHPKGKVKVGERLFVSESEKELLKQKNIRLVAQIWGNKPEIFHKIGARIRDQLNPETLFLGNGDVFSVSQGEELVAKFGLDGVMIGRGIFHNPWFFNPLRQSPSKSEKLAQLLLHTRLYEQNWSGKKNFNQLKRFYKIYTNDFTGAAQLRAQLMDAKTYEDVYQITNAFIKELPLL